MKNIFKLILSIVICELAGIAGVIFTGPVVKSAWYQDLNKSSLNPPNWVFGPVWTALFLLMGVSLYLVWLKNWKGETSQDIILPKKAWNPLSQKLWEGSWKEENVISIFLLQLILNIIWPVLFFGLQFPGLAFFELLMLWFAILYMIINFYRISKLAGLLLLPYILWVSFAGLLNFIIWIIN